METAGIIPNYQKQAVKHRPGNSTKQGFAWCFWLCLEFDTVFQDLGFI